MIVMIGKDEKNWSRTLTLRNLKKLTLHEPTIRVAGCYLATQEYALLEECLKEKCVEGAVWGRYRTMAWRYVEPPPSDIRAHLPDDVIRVSYPEVRVRFDRKRELEDPASRWFEFTGKGAGRIKCDSRKAEARCQEKAQLYDAMKQAARTLIECRT
jgi:hypothetical protein